MKIFFQSYCFLFVIFITLSAVSSEEIIKNTRIVSYQSGNDTVSGVLASPNGNGPFPALIVVHEWYGLNDWMKNNAAVFSQKGYMALAVDLYRGTAAQDSEEAHELMRGLPIERAVKDLKAAYTYLASQDNVDKENIGCIGWCMGGGYSLQAALNIPELDGCVICYGRIVTDQDQLKKIQSPVLGIFGKADRGISEDMVNEFASASKDAGVTIDVHMYDGAGHAFMREGNNYHEEATKDASQKIFSFFQTHLKD